VESSEKPADEMFYTCFGEDFENSSSGVLQAPFGRQSEDDFFPVDSLRINLDNESTDLLEKNMEIRNKIQADGFHDYERIERLGRGGFGSVYKAKMKETNEIVAIKISQYNFPSITEMEFLQKCNCEHIIKYYGAFKASKFEKKTAPTMWMIVEFCGGGSVEDLIRMNRKLSIEVIATVIKGVLNALQYLHINRILHRDIKPGNILLTASGKTKLADLGCSTQINPGGLAYSILGTPLFMAPELYVSRSGYTEKADIWSLGLTAFVMACGYDALETLHSHLLSACCKKDAGRFGSELFGFMKDLPLSFQNFVCSCLDLDYKSRPSAAALLSGDFIKSFSKDDSVLAPLCHTYEQISEKECETIKPLMECLDFTKQKNKKLVDNICDDAVLNICLDVDDHVKFSLDEIFGDCQDKSEGQESDPQEGDDLDSKKKSSLEKIEEFRKALFSRIKILLDITTPRVLFLGRSGKSDLINALYLKEIAENDETPEWFQGENFKILNTPCLEEKTTSETDVIGESFVMLEKNILDVITDEVEKEVPDVVLYVCSVVDITEESDEKIREDLRFVGQIMEFVNKKMGAYPALIGVVSNVAGVEIEQFSESLSLYLHNMILKFFEEFLGSKEDFLKLVPTITVTVSSEIEWNKKNGEITKQKFLNVDTVDKFINNFSLGGAIQKERMAQRATEFIKAWRMYINEILSLLLSDCNCTVSQFLDISLEFFYLIIKLVSVILNAPEKRFSCFWKSFLQEANWIWDKKAAGKINVYKGIFSWRYNQVTVFSVVDLLCEFSYDYFSQTFQSDQENSTYLKRLQKEFNDRLLTV